MLAPGATVDARWSFPPPVGRVENAFEFVRLIRVALGQFQARLHRCEDFPGTRGRHAHAFGRPGQRVLPVKKEADNPAFNVALAEQKQPDQAEELGVAWGREGPASVVR